MNKLPPSIQQLQQISSQKLAISPRKHHQKHTLKVLPQLYIKRTQSVHIKIAEADMYQITLKATVQGLSPQQFISDILNQYVDGRLVPCKDLPTASQ